MFNKLKTIVNALSNETPETTRFMLVGGAVRDAIASSHVNFNNPVIKDMDVEVFGCTEEQLLLAFKLVDGVKVEKVGQSFGVYKVYFQGDTFDFSFPRKEVKTGVGYKGFDVVVNPFMSFENACLRRDFTINAVMFDLKNMEIVDPFGGIGHIRKGVLRPVSGAFKEDPLRVLRAFQFIGRFDIQSVDMKVYEYALDLYDEKATLTPERVWTEWEKWCTKSKNPAKALEFLVSAGWSETELFNLLAVEQDPVHHPEGDVFVHTCHVVNAMNEISQNLPHDERIVCMLAALCHDFGKPSTTKWNKKKGKWTAYGHDLAGVEPTMSFLEKINCPQKYRKSIVTLVREHMVHLVQQPNEKNVRGLVNRLVDGGASMRMLLYVTEADQSGRPPKPKKQSEKILEFVQIMESLGLTGNEKIAPIVTGDFLIGQMGMVEGRELGEVMQRCYDQQLDGRITNIEGGQKYIQQHFKKVINGNV